MQFILSGFEYHKFFQENFLIERFTLLNSKYEFVIKLIYYDANILTGFIYYDDKFS